jgi:hypothetical protein
MHGVVAGLRFARRRRVGEAFVGTESSMDMAAAAAVALSAATPKTGAGIGGGCTFFLLAKGRSKLKEVG